MCELLHYEVNNTHYVVIDRELDFNLHYYGSELDTLDQATRYYVRFYMYQTFITILNTSIF